MPAHRVHICPVCQQRVIRGRGWRSIGGVRHHLTCSGGPGRPHSTSPRHSLLTIRMTADELAAVNARAERDGTTAAGLVRARLADVLEYRTR